MPTTLLALLLLQGAAPLREAPPRLLYIYRDSLKAGVDSAYRAIESDGAQVCADNKCPNPYFSIESLTGPHEVWWVNAFATDAETTRVARAYASNRSVTEALAAIADRKKTLIGKPVQGFAVYRAALSRGRAWSVAGARFVVIVVTKTHRRVAGTVWEMADSTLYVLRTATTRRAAEAMARDPGAQIFALRPNWSMPAPEWVAADPEFWRDAPTPKRER